MQKINYKYIIVGDANVGKTSIVKKFLYTDYSLLNNQNPTIGCDFNLYRHEINNDVKINVHIWDTSGQEKYRSLTISYFRNAICALLVFDVTNKSSFEFLENWINIIKNNTNNEKALIIIIGNKSDLQNKRIISYNDANNFALKYNIKYIETSAKNGTNIRDLFIESINKIYNETLYSINDINDINYILLNKNKNKNKNKNNNCVC